MSLFDVLKRHFPNHRLLNLSSREGMTLGKLNRITRDLPACPDTIAYLDGNLPKDQAFISMWSRSNRLQELETGFIRVIDKSSMTKSLVFWSDNYFEANVDNSSWIRQLKEHIKGSDANDKCVTCRKSFDLEVKSDSPMPGCQGCYYKQCHTCWSKRRFEGSHLHCPKCGFFNEIFRNLEDVKSRGLLVDKVKSET